MSINPQNNKEIYDHLLKIIASDTFREKKGLGNEVPFFICPYHPKITTQMEKAREQLVNKLESEGTPVLDINLYDLALELLRGRDIWERILEIEQTRTKSELLELLRNVLDPEKHLIPAIVKKMEAMGDFDVMFLSGVGEVFPYIRSHTVLNNLQKAAKEKPTVMFFPGEYTQSLSTGASLDLFGRLQDDKYYRAFNILHYTI